MKRPNITKIAALALPAVALLLTTTPVVANDFPDGVSPNDAYAAMDQVDRTTDRLLEAKQRKSAPTPKSYETDLQPMHVYQMAVACTNRTAELAASVGAAASDPVTVTPRKYFPKDVLEQAETMLTNLRAYADASDISGLPEDRGEFTDKTPSDVFSLSLSVFIKASTLTGNAKISPNEVFAQMSLAVANTKALLEHSGITFNTDGPKPEAGRKPADVFERAIQTREQINKICAHLGLDEISTSKLEEGVKIRPADVFIQAQIILAELNRIKVEAGMSESTPPPEVVAGKTPTDVWTQVALVGHLADQFRPQSLASAPTN